LVARQVSVRKKVKIVSIKHHPQGDHVLSWYEYELKGEKTSCTITEQDKKQRLDHFPPLEIETINGLIIYQEYQEDIKRGKTDLILMEYFTGITTYIENCSIRK
jgi:hypothetical protein